jgi:hypothetical protein
MRLEAQSGTRNIALLVFNLGARSERAVNATPRPLYSRVKASVALAATPLWTYLEEKNLVPPPGFQLRTVQPVASLCTVYTIPAQ